MVNLYYPVLSDTNLALVEGENSQTLWSTILVAVQHIFFVLFCFCQGIFHKLWLIKMQMGK